MMLYTSDGREVFLTSDNPDVPGVHMVKNLDGTTEPYTGKIEDLCVGVEIKSPVVFSGAVLYTSDKSMAVINRLKELAGKDCVGDRLHKGGKDNKTSVDIFDYVDDAYDGGVRSGEVQLAREILGMLGLR